MPTNMTTVRLNINRDHGSIEESTQDDTRIPIMISGLRGCFRPQLFLRIFVGDMCQVAPSNCCSFPVLYTEGRGRTLNKSKVYALKLKPQTLCPKP